jgi:hypothetical protein
MARWILFVLALLAAAGTVRAQSLVVSDRGTSRTYSSAQLLDKKAARNIEITDPVYKRTMTYRAIPMIDLLSEFKAGRDDYVQARALDEFSVAIPATLLKAFLAIETATTPWPKLWGAGTKSAGPFYIVWQSRPDADISSEYWVYHLASLTRIC